MARTGDAQAAEDPTDEAKPACYLDFANAFADLGDARTPVDRRGIRQILSRLGSGAGAGRVERAGIPLKACSKVWKY